VPRAQEDVEENGATSGPDDASGGGVEDGGLAISMTSRPGIDEWIEGTSKPATGTTGILKLQASTKSSGTTGTISVSDLMLPPLPFEPALLGAGTVAQLGYVEERDASNQSSRLPSSHSSDCDPDFGL
jgi:hypothetical protein